jgi:hypothetical protein
VWVWCCHQVRVTCIIEKLNKNNQQMFAMMFFFKAACCTLQNVEKAQERKINKKDQN